MEGQEQQLIQTDPRCLIAIAHHHGIRARYPSMVAKMVPDIGQHSVIPFRCRTMIDGIPHVAEWSLLEDLKISGRTFDIFCIDEASLVDPEVFEQISADNKTTSF